MNANELRIGNYVEIGLKRDLTSIYSTVHQISQTVIWVKEPSAPTLRLMPIETIKPIPLKEEWLLKFGFVITETNAEIECFYFWKRYSVLQPSNTNVWLLVDGEKGLCEIQFIHQLQNLYFALTNTELKCEKE